MAARSLPDSPRARATPCHGTDPADNPPTMFPRAPAYRLFSTLLCVTLLMAGPSGCARTPGRAAPSREATTAAGPTSRPVVSMPARRVSRLLDFESAADAAFVATDPPGAARIDSALAGGHDDGCLALTAQTRTLTIRLPTLLAGRAFPADWTLLGAYLHAERPVTVTLTCNLDGRPPLTRTISLGSATGHTGAAVWMPAMVDLSPLGGKTDEQVGEMTFAFNPSAEGVLVGDVMLIDNHETVIDTSAAIPATAESRGAAPSTPAASSIRWSVKRRGLNYWIDSAGRFSLILPTAEAERGGWKVTEASPLRICFGSIASPGSLTIYPDGRAYWGDALKLVAMPSASSDDAAGFAAHHTSPAQVSVPESMGRVDRSTAGDADNDGYNETRGGYTIVALGDRVEVTITPRGAAVRGAVLELSGLPPGDLRVTMDGRRLDVVARLKGGGVLVELPGRLDRPATVNVRVE